MRNVLIAAALLALPLAGCATQEAEKPCPPVASGYNLCAARRVALNPYADPETRLEAEMILMDAGATTPDQHALVRAIAQQPQPSTVVIAPAW